MQITAKLILHFFLYVSKSYGFQASFRQSWKFPKVFSHNYRNAYYDTDQVRGLEYLRTAVLSSWCIGLFDLLQFFQFCFSIKPASP